MKEQYWPWTTELTQKHSSSASCPVEENQLKVLDNFVHDNDHFTLLANIFPSSPRIRAYDVTTGVFDALYNSVHPQKTCFHLQ